MPAALLDTDTISEMLRRRNPIVEQNAAIYLKENGPFAFSAISYYEIVRGCSGSELFTNWRPTEISPPGPQFSLLRMKSLNELPNFGPRDAELASLIATPI